MLNDQPIKNAKEDLLNRATFAEDFADTILSYTSEINNVISINGEWGSGKTSLINMTKESLNNKIYEKSINGHSKLNTKYKIVDFKPWNALDENAIITQFFSALTYEKNVKKIKKIFNFIIKPLWNLIAFLLSFTNIGTPLTKINDLLIKYSKSFLKGDNTLIEKKEILNNKLLKYKGKIIVFIDDIDRLNKSEIRLLIQLIKAVCDFPNIIYVLSFDKSIVSSALSDEQSLDGNAYLEKIIQLSIDIPKIDEITLQNYLFGHLNVIISKYNIDFDDVRFNYIFTNGFSKYFNNLRNVNRFINSINFKVCKYVKVLDFVDFITIEAISLFEPNLLSIIYKNKSLLCSSFNKKLLSIFEKEVSAVSNKYQMLCYVFPILGKNENYSNDYNKSKTHGRLYLPQNYDFYFNGVLDKNYISKDYFKSLLCLNENEFKSQICQLSNFKFNELLSFFYAYIDEYDVKSINFSLVNILIECECYMKELTKLVHIYNDTFLSRIIEKKLLSINIVSEKKSFLEDLFNKIQNVRFLINLFFYLAKKTDFYHKNDSIDENVIPKDEIVIIHQILVERLKKIIILKDNLKSRDLRFYFYFLIDKNKDIIEEWFKTKSIDDIITAIGNFYTTSIISTNYSAIYLGYRLDLNMYKEFFDNNAIECKLKEKLIGTGADAEIGEVLYLMPDIPNDEHYSLNKIKEFANENSITFTKQDELVYE